MALILQIWAALLRADLTALVSRHFGNSQLLMHRKTN